MTKKVRFYLVASFIVTTRYFDWHCTRQFTPDLSNEANPLVSMVGMEWSGLTGVLVLLTAYCIFALWRATFDEISLWPEEKSLTFIQFSKFLMSGRKARRNKMFQTSRGEMRHFHAYNGHVLSIGLVWGGILTTLIWLGINHSEIYSQYHSTPAIYTLVVLGFIGLVCRWHLREYRNYLESGV